MKLRLLSFFFKHVFFLNMFFFINVTPEMNLSMLFYSCFSSIKYEIDV